MGAQVQECVLNCISRLRVAVRRFLAQMQFYLERSTIFGDETLNSWLVTPSLVVVWGTSHVFHNVLIDSPQFYRRLLPLVNLSKFCIMYYRRRHSASDIVVFGRTEVKK